MPSLDGQGDSDVFPFSGQAPGAHRAARRHLPLGALSASSADGAGDAELMELIGHSQTIPWIPGHHISICSSGRILPRMHPISQSFGGSQWVSLIFVVNSFRVLFAGGWRLQLIRQVQNVFRSTDAMPRFRSGESPGLLGSDVRRGARVPHRRSGFTRSPGPWVTTRGMLTDSRESRWLPSLLVAAAQVEGVRPVVSARRGCRERREAAVAGGNCGY